MVFDAPYNKLVSTPRMFNWRTWRSVIMPLLGKTGCEASLSHSTSSSDTDLFGDLGMSRGRNRATSDALLAGFHIPHMNMPHVSRPIGMLKLKRDVSNGSDVSVQSLGPSKTPQEIQDNVDMLQSSMDYLSPEDMATILSGSMSLMDDDCDLCSETSVGSHSEERTERIKSLTEAAAKRHTDRQKELVEAQRKAALESSAADSYRPWQRSDSTNSNK